MDDRAQLSRRDGVTDKRLRMACHQSSGPSHPPAAAGAAAAAESTDGTKATATKIVVKIVPNDASNAKTPPRPRRRNEDEIKRD